MVARRCVLVMPGITRLTSSTNNKKESKTLSKSTHNYNHNRLTGLDNWFVMTTVDMKTTEMSTVELMDYGSTVEIAIS